ncbi:MAG: hypothetical protein WC708_10550 [Lentisphaeria bacterium]
MAITVSVCRPPENAEPQLGGFPCRWRRLIEHETGHRAGSRVTGNRDANRAQTGGVIPTFRINLKLTEPSDGHPVAAAQQLQADHVFQHPAKVIRTISEHGGAQTQVAASR